MPVRRIYQRKGSVVSRVNRTSGGIVMTEVPDWEKRLRWPWVTKKELNVTVSLYQWTTAWPR